MAIDPIRILIIFVALGLVIFVHELGHFLAARWAGVLVERFSIGFGPVLWSFRRGDTEYALSAIPLGGYVQMLGQTDTPGVDEASDDARDYQNKTVFQRMVIISAGVIFNMIFALVCFIVAFRLGVPYQPAVVGAALPGMPAWNSGMRSGDEITDLNGVTPRSFEKLLGTVMTSRPGVEILMMNVARPDGSTFPIKVSPEAGKDKPQIGIAGSHGLVLMEQMPAWPKSAASQVGSPGLNGGETVLAVAGQPVANHWQYIQQMATHAGKPVDIKVRRKGQADGKVAAPEVNLTIPPTFVRTLGFQLRIGEIVAVQDDSPAKKAVGPDGKPLPIEPRAKSGGVGGDLLAAIDGEPIQNFDPFRLGDYFYSRAGEEVKLTLTRRGKDTGEIQVTVRPEAIPPWIDYSPYSMYMTDQAPLPLSIPALGLAYRVQPVVVAVAENSPAATAETPMQPGDEITRLEFVLDEQVPDGFNPPKAIDVTEDSWPTAFFLLQNPMIRKVVLTYKRDGVAKTVNLVPQPDSSWPFWISGLFFDTERRIHLEKSVVGAARAGMERTYDEVTRLFGFLFGVGRGDIDGSKFLSGPITMGRAAYYLAYSVSLLILFLGIINVNLAVINFLPIPILDGGHMVFLIWEGIAGKKPPQRVVEFASWVGLILILSLMVTVLTIDIRRWIMD